MAVLLGDKNIVKCYLGYNLVPNAYLGLYELCHVAGAICYPLVQYVSGARMQNSGGQYYCSGVLIYDFSNGFGTDKDYYVRFDPSTNKILSKWCAPGSDVNKNFRLIGLINISGVDYFCYAMYLSGLSTDPRQITVYKCSDGAYLTWFDGTTGQNIDSNIVDTTNFAVYLRNGFLRAWDKNPLFNNVYTINWPSGYTYSPACAHVPRPTVATHDLVCIKRISDNAMAFRPLYPDTAGGIWGSVQVSSLIFGTTITSLYDPVVDNNNDIWWPGDVGGEAALIKTNLSGVHLGTYKLATDLGASESSPWPTVNGYPFLYHDAVNDTVHATKNSRHYSIDVSTGTPVLSEFIAGGSVNSWSYYDEPNARTISGLPSVAGASTYFSAVRMITDCVTPSSCVKYVHDWDYATSGDGYLATTALIDLIGASYITKTLLFGSTAWTAISGWYPGAPTDLSDRAVLQVTQNGVVSSADYAALALDHTGTFQPADTAECIFKYTHDSQPVSGWTQVGMGVAAVTGAGTLGGMVYASDGVNMNRTAIKANGSGVVSNTYSAGSHTIAAKHTYFTRVKFVGDGGLGNSKLYIKTWQLDSPEPASWDITLDETQFTVTANMWFCWIIPRTAGTTIGVYTWYHEAVIGGCTLPSE